MPAHVSGLGTVSVKVVSVNPRNRNGSLQSTSATIYVFDSKTGSELARVAGDNLTAIRTAASSALATELLALRETDSLGNHRNRETSSCASPSDAGSEKHITGPS